METRTRLERCQWCSNQLAVPIHVQIISCPVCRRTNHLAPATNTGHYQQQPPPQPIVMYNSFNQRPPSQTVGMYSNGFGRRPTFNQQSMRPSANYDNGNNIYNNDEDNDDDGEDGEDDDDDDASIPTMNYNDSYNQQASIPPKNNNNGGYHHQVSIPPMNNNNGGYNNQVSPRPMNNSNRNGGYNHQASIPSVNNNGSYNNQVSPRPMNISNGSGGYNHQASIPPVNNNYSSYNNQVSPRPMNNSNGNGGYNHQASIPPVNNNNGYSNQVSTQPMSNTNGNDGYNHQASIPPVNNSGSSNNQVSPRPVNNSYGNGAYNNQVSPRPMNNNPGGYNAYHHQQTPAPPINHNYGNFNHVSPSPPKYEKKRAVLCGISYMNTTHSLDCSVTDVESVKNLLIDTMGFLNSSIIVLTELESNPMRIPTSKNIITALRWLVQGCQAGDSLVFYYTGHGSRVADDGDDEYDGYDEALCPVDYKTAGKLLDDQINEIIVRPLPRGVQLHTIIDTCYSGTALDLCYINRSNSRGKYFWEGHENSTGAYQGTNGGLAVCISACDDHQKSGNTTAFTGNATGALTYSFVKALRSEPTSTYGHLMNNMRTEISSVQSGLGLNASNASASTQEPQLSSSEKFDIYSKKIVL